MKAKKPKPPKASEPAQPAPAPAPMKPRVRQRMITREQVEAIVAATKACLSMEGACGRAGRPRCTVLGWIGDGRRLAEMDEPGELTPQQELCLELYERMAAARADVEEELVTAIREAVGGVRGGDWMAAKFILERRWQQEWSQRVMEGIEEGFKQALDLLKERLTPEEWTRVRRALARDARTAGEG